MLVCAACASISQGLGSQICEPWYGAPVSPSVPFNIIHSKHIPRHLTTSTGHSGAARLGHLPPLRSASPAKRGPRQPPTNPRTGIRPQARSFPGRAGPGRAGRHGTRADSGVDLADGAREVEPRRALVHLPPPPPGAFMARRQRHQRPLATRTRGPDSPGGSGRGRTAVTALVARRE